MDRMEESDRSRLSKEERIGPGGKPSSQKFPCRAVVGSRPFSMPINDNELISAFRRPPDLSDS
ncbi:hypothetical protein OUZ56_025204 [Daphnia magna]|uniref:Uncharacterized protein n=1 Tax=Daphnia magna TaxID=35525 RepID=A0ABQ9ZJA0_9CRUS|nr:hypothetical protein OUZ56_025204 [Daphnia magna]